MAVFINIYQKIEATNLRSPVNVLVDPYFFIHMTSMQSCFPVLRVRMKLSKYDIPQNVDRLAVVHS